MTFHRHGRACIFVGLFFSQLNGKSYAVQHTINNPLHTINEARGFRRGQYKLSKYPVALARVWKSLYTFIVSSSSFIAYTDKFHQKLRKTRTFSTTHQQIANRFEMGRMTFKVRFMKDNIYYKKYALNLCLSKEEKKNLKTKKKTKKFRNKSLSLYHTRQFVFVIEM